MKVALVDKEELGGTCLNWGCIPTKALLKSAEVLATVKIALAYGVMASDVSFYINAMVINHGL